MAVFIFLFHRCTSYVLGVDQLISRCERGPFGAHVSPSRGFLSIFPLTPPVKVSRYFFLLCVFYVPSVFLFIFLSVVFDRCRGHIFRIRRSSASRWLSCLCPRVVCNGKPRFCVPSPVIIVRDNGSWFILISVYQFCR